MEPAGPTGRAAERVATTVVGIELGSVCGTGRIYDVSATGLRIEESQMLPTVGEAVRLTFVLSVEQPAFEVEGTVARHTESGGFAVVFRAVDARLEGLIEELARQVQKLPGMRTRSPAVD